MLRRRHIGASIELDDKTRASKSCTEWLTCTSSHSLCRVKHFFIHYTLMDRKRNISGPKIFTHNMCWKNSIMICIDDRWLVWTTNKLSSSAIFPTGRARCSPFPSHENLNFNAWKSFIVIFVSNSIPHWEDFQLLYFFNFHADFKSIWLFSMNCGIFLHYSFESLTKTTLICLPMTFSRFCLLSVKWQVHGLI